jgi:mono/diheme cytochrome c family protein
VLNICDLLIRFAAECRGAGDLQPLIQIKVVKMALPHTQPKAEEVLMNKPAKRSSRPVGATVLAIVAAGVLAACAPEPVPSAGAQAYQDYCAICHGTRALGDGPVAPELEVPPPDLTLIASRNGGVFPLRAVADTVYGYAGKHEADLMPEFSPLLDGPDVAVLDGAGGEEIMPVRLAEVVTYLQSLQRP